MLSPPAIENARNSHPASMAPAHGHLTPIHRSRHHLLRTGFVGGSAGDAQHALRVAAPTPQASLSGIAVLLNTASAGAPHGHIDPSEGRTGGRHRYGLASEEPASIPKLPEIVVAPALQGTTSIDGAAMIIDRHRGKRTGYGQKPAINAALPPRWHDPFAR